MKLTGSKAICFFDTFDESKAINGDGVTETEPGAWYRVMAKGASSELPLETGFVFRAPGEGADQIVLAAGDKVYPLDPSRFCKTGADFSAEEGSVDVGDDCDPGATIPDGIVTYSGSLNGFFRYDDATGEFDDVTTEIVNRFFDVVTDDGEGAYGKVERNSSPAHLLCCLNGNAKPGQTENWISMPINITSMSMSLGNADAQNRDLSWSKGEGPAVIYKRKKAA
jgi:hypothetical protein